MTRLALAALALLPSLALAQAAPEERYSLDAAQCGNSGYDGIVSVEGDGLRYWETSCTLTNPIPVREMDGAVLYDAECSAEGMIEKRRLLLMPLMDGGLGIAQRGAMNTYARCGD